MYSCVIGGTIKIIFLQSNDKVRTTMKWYVAVLTLAAPLMPVYGSTADQMFNQSTKQSYQIVGGTKQAGASLVAVSPDTSAPAGHLEALPDDAVKPSTEANQESVTLKGSSALQDEVAGLARSQVIFQQQTIESLRNLSSQNRQLANEIQTLYQHVSVLEKQVSTPLASSQRSDQVLHWASIKSLFVADQWGVEQYSLLAVVFILVVFICYRICFNQKKSVEAVGVREHPHLSVSDDKDDEGDYDYLQSEEGLGAQLDLARAYIAMKDYQAAENALMLVKRSGDPVQKAAAEALCEQVESATKRKE